MIRINLLNQQDQTSSTSASGQPVAELVIMGLLVLVGLIGVYAWYYSMNERIEWAKNKVRLERQEVAKLQVAIKTVKKFKATKKYLKKRLEIIDKLERSKRGPVRILNELSIRIPKQVWLRTIRQKGNRLIINADAESNEWVAAFLKKLEDSPFFKTVELKGTWSTKGTVLGTQRNIERIRFRTICQVSLAT